MTLSEVLSVFKTRHLAIPVSAVAGGVIIIVRGHPTWLGSAATVVACLGLGCAIAIPAAAKWLAPLAVAIGIGGFFQSEAGGIDENAEYSEAFMAINHFEETRVNGGVVGEPLESSAYIQEARKACDPITKSVETARELSSQAFEIVYLSRTVGDAVQLHHDLEAIAERPGRSGCPRFIAELAARHVAVRTSLSQAHHKENR